jgi:hypothetical protein
VGKTREQGIAELREQRKQKKLARALRRAAIPPSVRAQRQAEHERRAALSRIDARWNKPNPDVAPDATFVSGGGVETKKRKH